MHTIKASDLTSEGTDFHQFKVKSTFIQYTLGASPSLVSSYCEG